MPIELKCLRYVIAAIRACPEVAPSARTKLLNVFMVPFPFITQIREDVSQCFALYYSALDLNYQFTF
jgi:hypothetical protein